MNQKQKYVSPYVQLEYVENDIITYSETDVWSGPVIAPTTPTKSNHIEEVK